MPSFEYSQQHQAYIKQCSCCKDVVIGTKDQVESVRIFEEVFAPAGPSSGMADGMQSRCWCCNSRSRRELGITRTEINAMFEAQNGKCAICAKGISIVRYAEPSIIANVDHDQNTGKIRELLCGDCNRGIGLLKDNPRILQAAIAYVRKHIPNEVNEVVVSIRRRA